MLESFFEWGVPAGSHMPHSVAMHICVYVCVEMYIHHRQTVCVAVVVAHHGDSSLRNSVCLPSNLNPPKFLKIPASTLYTNRRRSLRPGVAGDAC